jgi:hypothetical protein
MEMEKILKSMEAFQPERINWREANLPEPSEELFRELGRAMNTNFKAQMILSLNIDPKTLRSDIPKPVEECWTTVARMCYKYIALAGGASTERID